MWKSSLSVCNLVSPPKLLDRFAQNLILEAFTKRWREIPILQPQWSKIKPGLHKVINKISHTFINPSTNNFEIRYGSLPLILVSLFLLHEGVCGSGCIDPHFLDLDTSWWVVTITPRPLNPGERITFTHSIGGWVNPRTGLDYVEKRKFLTLPGLELPPLGRPTRSQSLYRLISSNKFQDSQVVILCTSLRNIIYPVLFLYISKIIRIQTGEDHRCSVWNAHTWWWWFHFIEKWYPINTYTILTISCLLSYHRVICFQRQKFSSNFSTNITFQLPYHLHFFQATFPLHYWAKSTRMTDLRKVVY
jgi:hypothetical protein